MKSHLRRLIGSTIAGTVVLVAWGMIFWAWLADPVGVFHTLPNASAIAQALEANGTTTGTYFFPWPRNTQESFAAFVDQHKRGPFFLLSYRREGVDPQSGAKLLGGVLHYVTVAFIATLLVSLVGNRRYAVRAATVLLAGLLGSDFITLGNPIWFHLPWDYTLGNFCYEIISWLLLAAVIAALIRPPVALE